MIVTLNVGLLIFSEADLIETSLQHNIIHLRARNGRHELFKPSGNLNRLFAQLRENPITVALTAGQNLNRVMLLRYNKIN